MAEAPYMQFYVGDYMADTTHLTTEQHGAYLLLLMAMWAAGGELPNDPKKLARTARLSFTRWSKISPEIMAFFTVEGDAVTQKRLKKEREKAREKSVNRAEAGKRGGDAKALKYKKTDVANATILPKQNPSIPEPEPEPLKSPVSKDTAADAAPKVVSLPAGKPVEAQCYALAEEILGPRTGGLVTKLAKLFRYDWPAVRAILREARDKHNPREWIGRQLTMGDLTVEEYYALRGAS